MKQYVMKSINKHSQSFCWSCVETPIMNRGGGWYDKSDDFLSIHDLYKYWGRDRYLKISVEIKY